MSTLKGGRSSARIKSNPQSTLRRYELHRDGDRELHFDGTEMAAIESGGSETGGVVYRAAVYRTRGGKFVSEFSSRPNPSPSPYRDPPVPPTTEELKEFKELVLQSVLDTAEWREGKARQFPSDARNARSAEALRELVPTLEDVWLKDQRWIDLWLAENGLDVDLIGDDRSNEILDAQREAKSDLLRNYGFHPSGNAPSSGSDALAFMDELHSALRNAAEPEPTDVPRGKAQAFETVDEALKWFRPGPLTADLLKLMGRMEPEFID